MNTKGIPVSRWIDGVLEDKDNIAQKDNVRAMVFWGHASNSQTRGVEMRDYGDMNWCCGGGGGISANERADALRHKLFARKKRQLHDGDIYWHTDPEVFIAAKPDGELGLKVLECCSARSCLPV